VLAGCGGAQVDSGGFTAGDRKDAEAVLETLRHTSIPTTLVSITNTGGIAPSECRIHRQSTNPRTFRLFLFWTPLDPKHTGNTYTWLEATIGKDVLQDAFRVGHSGGSSTNVQALKSRHRNVFSKPVAQCEVLMNGYLRLLAAN
jgi:hypothetical protein